MEKWRGRRIQTTEPSAQGGASAARSGSFSTGAAASATPLNEIAAQRLAASDEAVVAVGRREWRQESECLAATIAEAAANPDPLMVFIVSLLAPAAVADNGVLYANRAAAENDFCAPPRPNQLRGCRAWRKVRKRESYRGGPAGDVGLPKIRTRGRDLHLLSKIPTGKE